MNVHNVRLIDSSRNLIAVAQLAEVGNIYSGSIDLRRMPAGMRALFDEFEDLVNGQMFSLAEEAEEKIESLTIKAIFENGQEFYLKDLQVFPSSGEVSLKLAALATVGMKSA